MLSAFTARWVTIGSVPFDSDPADLMSMRQSSKIVATLIDVHPLLMSGGRHPLPTGDGKG